ncbi:hypothetical protein [Paenibacillus sp. KS-LC4]
MFRVQFRIVEDDIQILSKINSEQFDETYGDITGQIELTLGKMKIY